MSDETIMRNVRSKLQEMQDIARLHRELTGSEIHKVSLLRQVFNVRPGNNAKYRAATKIYNFARERGII